MKMKIATLGIIVSFFFLQVNGKTGYLADSSITKTTNRIDSLKRIYTYDSNGYQKLETTYTWNTTTSKWDLLWKEETAFDSNGNQTLDAFYRWKATLAIWEAGQKYETTYDNKGNRTLEVYYYSDSKSKTEFTYDSNSRFLQSISYSWNNTTQVWEQTEKQESTYDKTRIEPLYTTIFKWNSDSSSWDNYYKYVSVTKGDLMIETVSVWNSIATQWQNFTKKEYLINSIQITEISYLWNNETLKWGNETRYDYLLDANGNESSNDSYNWNKTKSSWNNESRSEYYYDEIGKKTEGSSYSWNSITATWNAPIKTYWYYTLNDYTFSVSEKSITFTASADTKATVTVTSDKNWRIEQLAPWLQVTKKTGKGNDTITFTASVNEGSDRSSQVVIATPYGKEVIYISQNKAGSVAVSEVQNRKTVMYPNPAKNSFSFYNDNLTKVEIVTLSGIIVLQKDVEGKENIQIDGLLAGCYIVKFTRTNGEVISQQLIVE